MALQGDLKAVGSARTLPFLFAYYACRVTLPTALNSCRSSCFPLSILLFSPLPNQFYHNASKELCSIQQLGNPLPLVISSTSLRPTFKCLTPFYLLPGMVAAPYHWLCVISQLSFCWLQFPNTFSTKTLLSIISATVGFRFLAGL